MKYLILMLFLCASCGNPPTIGEKSPLIITSYIGMENGKCLYTCRKGIWISGQFTFELPCGYYQVGDTIKLCK